MPDGVFNANQLFAEIRALGCTGGKTILKEFLKPFRPLQKLNATMRFETKPGSRLRSTSRCSSTRKRATGGGCMPS